VSGSNLYARIEAVARARGAAPAWVVPGGRTWSFADLHAGSGRWLAALRRLGVGPGMRVVSQVEKSPGALLLYLATLRAGAVLVPLNTAYTPAEVDYFLRDAEPRLVVCDPARAAAMRVAAADAAAGTVPAIVAMLDAAGRGDLPDAGEDPGTEAVDAGDLAAIVYTSGTTGRAKGAMLTHGNLASNAEALVGLWRFTAADRLVHALPIHHVHGLFVATHCALLSGAAMTLLPKFDAAQLVELFRGGSVFMGVPTHYVRLLAERGLDRSATRAMRVFISGSAPLLPQTFEEFERRTGQRILERYGMSEAGMITSNPCDGERVSGTVGFALPGVEVRIVDADGREQPRGAPGVLELRGPNVCRGYWRQPERRSSDFRADGFFVSGDVATMDASGRVTLVGRAKDLIISGGLNVYPKEIELELDALPGVVESAVVGVPHPDFGEAVIAAVAVAPGAGLTEAAVMQALQGRLARFKQPKRAFLVEELPRNAMGKVLKATLRERYASTFNSTSPPVASA
jgi:malonyl-CoA/methylmalonyl-CoA synthetase